MNVKIDFFLDSISEWYKDDKKIGFHFLSNAYHLIIDKFKMAATGKGAKTNFRMTCDIVCVICSICLSYVYRLIEVTSGAIAAGKYIYRPC